jgi:hypothetical protein
VADNPYRDRAHLSAYLAAVNPSVLVHGADPNEPDWPVLFVTLPTGQVSWHVSPDDLDLFDHVTVGHATWDGHSTDEKNDRIRRYVDMLTQKGVTHG